MVKLIDKAIVGWLVYGVQQAHVLFTHVSTFCYTCFNVLLHMFQRSVTHVSMFCYTCFNVLLHMFQRSVTHVSTFCYTCFNVLLHMFQCSVTHMLKVNYTDVHFIFIETQRFGLVFVLNITFNNNSVISWRSF
jgi:hypothetical protein